MQDSTSKIQEKMRDLYDSIPDPDDVLALSPEELAGKLILILRKIDEPINVPRITGLIPVAWPHPLNGDGYPEDRCHEIRGALWDAFEWLEDHGLIERSDKISGPDWIRVLSSEAKKIRNEKDFQKLMLWRSVNEDMLHPRIAKKAVDLLTRGERADAIGYAMRSVEIAVREACGLGDEAFGVNLMREAFSKGGTLHDQTANQGGENGLKSLFEGAIGVYKNRHSHKDAPVEDVTEALTLVMFASHLLHIVDSRKSQNRRG